VHLGRAQLLSELVTYPVFLKFMITISSTLRTVNLKQIQCSFLNIIMGFKQEDWPCKSNSNKNVHELIVESVLFDALLTLNQRWATYFCT
jgi:hypothetical protein